MKKTLYIFSNGEIRRKQNTLYFESEDGKRKYLPVENIGEIMVFGEVTVNKRLMEFIAEKHVILHFFNHFGYYVGSFYPREHYNSGYMILKQTEHYLDEEKRVELAKRFVMGAMENMIKVLSYYERREVEGLATPIEQLRCLEAQIADVPDVERLMAIEGNAKDIYYRCFDNIIGDEEFSYTVRTRQPPRNRLNAMISFGNSLLYVEALRAIYETHLDPRIGYLHATNFRRFTLNLDVAEVFKPIIVDRLIFALLNKKMIQPKHFTRELGGVYMNEKGRRVFVEEWEKKLNMTVKLPSLKRNVSYRRLLLLELYKIEKHLIGEKEYSPFVMAW